MSSVEQQFAGSQTNKFNICLIDPALLPKWFWLPTAHKIEQQGHNYYVPDLERGNYAATAEDTVDAIESTMKDYDLQYVVCLSRGVEFGIRYLDRLAKKNALGKVVGWMVISSAGPRGYEAGYADEATQVISRHTAQYMEGITVDEKDFEIIDRDVAETTMLHDVRDAQLRAAVLDSLIPERPLTDDEIRNVPRLDNVSLPLAWYIGLNDKVDNIALSAAVAEQQFGVTPEYTDWGHVGPISHTDEVSRAILAEAQKALLLWKGDS